MNVKFAQVVVIASSRRRGSKIPWRQRDTLAASVPIIQASKYANEARLPLPPTEVEAAQLAVAGLSSPVDHLHPELGWVLAAEHLDV